MISTILRPSDVNYSQVRLTIRNLQPQLITWRRRLHQRPELGFQERLTANFISQKLTTWGIPHQTGIAGTGVVATINGSRPGPVLGIRADMDALQFRNLTLLTTALCMMAPCMPVAMTGT